MALMARIRRCPVDEMKAHKLREKLGISATDQKEAAGKAIGSNLRNKISDYSVSGGNFVSAPGAGGNFVSAASVTDATVAESRPGTGGNFVSAPGSGGNFVSAP